MKVRSATSARSLPLILGAVAVAFACSSAEQGYDAVVVQDSAGVRVVANRSPSGTAEPIWRVGSEPLLALGKQGPGRDEFYRVVGVVQLDDGSVVVADAGSNSILWFTMDGVRDAESGGAGDGPGEFRSLAWIGKARADSVYAWDSQLKRLSVVYDGRFERSLELEPSETWPGITLIGSLVSGDLVAFGGYGVPGAETPLGVHREEVPVWILSPTGSVHSEVDHVASYAMEYRAGATPGTVMRGLLPFGPTTLIATGMDRIVVGDNASYELRMFDGSGTLVQIVRLHEAPERVQAEDLALELERRLASAPPIEEIRDGIRANFAATPVPEFKPFYGLLRVDADENTWVLRTSATPSSSASWDVFATEGGWLGSFLTPPGVHVTYIGADQIFGVRTDELGVEEVVAFELHR